MDSKVTIAAPKTDLINQIVGDWGKWQRQTTFLIFLCKIPSAWFMACIIFTAPYAKNGEFVCKQTKPDTTFDTLLNPVINHTDLRSIEQPLIRQAATANSPSTYDYCHVYEDSHRKVLMWQQRQREQFNETSEKQHLPMDVDAYGNRNSSARIVPCEQFEHHSIYHSLVTQFDLVCSRTILIAVTQFYHLFGVLTGGILASKLLDFFSPRKVMLFGMVTQIFCGCITGLANDLRLHIFFRYLSAVCCAQMYTAGSMIFSDITGGSYRKSIICLFETFWGIGVIILPLIAHYFPDWSSIYLVISLPTIGYIILWAWIPDSPRWLLKHGQIDSSKKILLHAATVNRRNDCLPSHLDYLLKIETAASLKQPPPLGWCSLWSDRKAVIKMIALHMAWAVYVTNYNGMLLNIRAFGRDYITVNTIVAGISEIVGVLIAWFFVIKTNKHKWMWTGLFNICSGILTCFGFLFPSTLPESTFVILGMTLAMISKAATTCSQAVLFTCTGELVPATKQKICIYSCIVWARIWLLTAPFIGVLTFVHDLLPMVIFGMLGLVGGIGTCVISRQQNCPKIYAITNIPIERRLSSKSDVFVIEKTKF